VLLLSRAETRTPDEDHDQSILIESIELEVGGASIEFKWNELGRRSTTLV